MVSGVGEGLAHTHLVSIFALSIPTVGRTVCVWGKGGGLILLTLPCASGRVTGGGVGGCNVGVHAGEDAGGGLVRLEACRRPTPAQ